MFEALDFVITGLLASLLPSIHLRITGDVINSDRCEMVEHLLLTFIDNWISFSLSVKELISFAFGIICMAQCHCSVSFVQVT